MASTTVEPGESISAVHASAGWLVGPWVDAIFIANVAWPLLVLLQLGDGFSGRAGIEFWQLYFITTPHRWITLFIVFLDGERYRQRRSTFLALAAGAAIVTCGVRLGTGTLTCLMAIDYLWNAWHFAAQHHGIDRIYGRLGDAAVRQQPERWQKWAMRGFLLYVIVRVASATWSEASWLTTLERLDWIVLPIPIGLVVWALLRRRAESAGRLLYRSSVCCLYTCLLWAVHEHRNGLVLCLATASALFHAIEYLALVSWAVHQRHEKSAEAMGVLGHLVPRWGIALCVFVVVLGAGAWFMTQEMFETWLFINVIVAYLHYAYDGLIWRRSAPAT